MSSPLPIGLVSPPPHALRAGPSLILALEFWRAFAGHDDAPITIQAFDDIEARREARKESNKERARLGQPKEVDPFAAIRYGSIRTLWPLISQLQEHGAGIFYTINHCDGRGRSAKNIIGVRAAACDHDNDPPRSLPFDPARVNPAAPPSIVVASSPGNFQSLWRLAENQSPEEWGPLHAEHLIPHFRSDKACHDLPRVFRLPGTLHQKRGTENATLVTAAYYDVGRLFSIADLRAAYPRTTPERAPALLQATPTTAPLATDADATAMFGERRAAALTLIGQNWPAEGSRHIAQFALAGALCLEFADDRVAYEALCAVCRIAGSEEREKRWETIARTRERLNAGEKITGWTALAEHIAPAVIATAREWISARPALPEGLAASLASTIVAQTPQATQADAWTALVTVDNHGIPKGSIGNTITILQHHKAWKDLLAYNTRAMKIVLEKIPWLEEFDDGRPCPRYIDNEDGGRTAQWLSHTQRMSVSSAIAIEAMLVVAKRNAFDPVVDYLDALPPWDGVLRLDTWLRVYAGAETSDVATAMYYSVAGKRYLVQAVARSYRPGCQADMMLILEGPQGILKSSLLRELFVEDEFFSDQMPSIDTKDAKQHVHGPWGIEMPELAAAGKAKVEAIKAFLTLRDDNFRMPYARVEERTPRGCVFAGTINPDENGYLKDPTGARRFLPVLCTGTIDIAGMRRDRDQLWAEARHLYFHPDRHEVSWLTREEMRFLAAPQQEARTESDALEEKIARGLADGVRRDFALVVGAGGAGAAGGGMWAIPPGATDVGVGDIMQHLCADKGDLGPGLQQRVGRALRKLGWEKYSVPVSGGRPFYRYRLKPLGVAPY